MASKKKVVKKKPLKKRIAAKKAVKKVSRKPAKKVIKKKPVIKVAGKVVGKITHYFPKVRAAVIKLTAPLSSGDKIKVKGHTTDFTQAITSMQLDHEVIAKAKKGMEIGLLVNSRVREHDVVYKV